MAALIPDVAVEGGHRAISDSHDDCDAAAANGACVGCRVWGVRVWGVEGVEGGVSLWYALGNFELQKEVSYLERGNHISLSSRQ